MDSPEKASADALTLPARHFLYYGREDAPPEERELKAGPWSATFVQGEVLNIRWRKHEVVHRIYAAVRDRNWATIVLQLFHVSTQEQSDNFRIAFDARHRAGEIDFAWKGNVEATASGPLTFDFEGEALSTFLRSRIGFCILHSVEECVGRPFSVLQPDGATVKGLFPEAIAQDEIITGTEAMAALTYAVAPGVKLTLHFEGDVFQMEDQRPWTDASFKTFCTPLQLPCPVLIQRGTKVRQRVRLEVTEERPAAVAPRPEQQDIVITPGSGPPLPIPEIGLGMASHGEPWTEREAARLQVLRVSHLRVDLKLGETGWRAELQRAVGEAEKLACELEVALFITDPVQDELASLLKVLREVRPPVARWLILPRAVEPTPEPTIRLARSALVSWDASARIGSGTNPYYYQLSGLRPPHSPLDFVSFAIQPQEHSSDHASLMATVRIHCEVVENARRLFGGLPISVSPVTLKPRFNPNATGPEPVAPVGELPPQVDARQMSLLGAVWTLGSLKYLSESGARSVTYYETTGWRGVIERDTGSPLPAKFPSLPGAAFPLYHVLADVGEFAGGKVIPSCCADPRKVASLMFCKGANRRVLVGNLTRQKLSVNVQGLPSQLRMKILDEITVRQAIVGPEEYRSAAGAWQDARAGLLRLELRPYAIARIDWRASE